MNLLKLERDLSHAITDVYRIKFDKENPPVDHVPLDARIDRMRSLRARVSARRQALTPKRRRDQKPPSTKIGPTFAAQIAEVRAFVANGKRIVSIDCEAHRKSRKMTEIGVTIHQSGVTTSHNLRIAEMADYQDTDTFAFGTTREMPRPAVHAWLTREMAMADIFVGHSFKDDRRMLAEEGCPAPEIAYYDTASWSRTVIPGNLKRSLGNLCAAFGVNADHPHNGGNDARYTLDVLLAIVAAQP